MLNFRIHIPALVLAISILCYVNADVDQQKPLVSSGDTDSIFRGLLQQQIPDSQPPPGGNWLGWGAGVYNNRWAASDAIVDVPNIANLARVCSVSYSPAGLSAPPLVEDGVAYYSTWNGLLVALKYATCDTLWSTNITRIVQDFKPQIPPFTAPVTRTTPVSDGDVLFIGTLSHALLVAIDKRTGQLIDSLQMDRHPFAMITQSPTFYGGRLYIGVSSQESVVADLIPGYECCTFTGSFNAVSLNHGRLRLLWTTPTIGSGNANFSGAAVWGSQPSIDPIRGQVFIGTGQVYSLPQAFEDCQKQTANITVVKEGLTAADPCLPRTVYQDSILALDLATGRINWVKQLSALDAWNLACVDLPGLPPGGNPDACPETPGPDADFGIAPTFVLGSKYTPYGLDIIVASQKNGILYALSAAAGTVLWKTVTGPGGLEGGLTWGVAVDDRAVYFTNTNSMHGRYKMLDGSVISNSAFGAASLTDGRILWLTPAPHNHDSYVPPSVVNDVVLVGTSGTRGEAIDPTGPGLLTPLDKRTGRVLRQIKLDALFKGGIASVHDYVLFGTGYGGTHAAVPGSFQTWKLKSNGKASMNTGVAEL